MGVANLGLVKFTSQLAAVAHSRPCSANKLQAGKTRVLEFLGTNLGASKNSLFRLPVKIPVIHWKRSVINGSGPIPRDYTEAEGAPTQLLA